MIYPRAVVERTARAFRTLATICVESTPEHHRIRFSRIVAEAPQELLDDFANHALSCAVNES